MKKCIDNTIPQGSKNLPASSDRVQAPAAGAGPMDFGEGQIHEPNKKEPERPRTSGTGIWNTILVLMEEQQRTIEALRVAVQAAKDALPKNAPIPVKDNMQKALVHIGSILSTGLALRAAKDGFGKELLEAGIPKRARGQRERAASLGSAATTPRPTSKTEKREASKTPEGNTPKRGRKEDKQEDQKKNGPWQEVKKKRPPKPKEVERNL